MISIPKVIIGDAELKRLFVESSSFKKFIDNQSDPELLKKIQLELLKDPLKGDVIEGTGGVRKFRFAPTGRGTRGGYRVLYLDLPSLNVCHLLVIFSKTVKENISAEEKKLMKQLVDFIKKGGSI
jgi:hypothetical protein